MKLQNKIKNLKRFLKSLKKNELEILPGNLAFSLILSIVPVLTLFVLFASIFNLSIEPFIKFLNITLPTEASELLLANISNTPINLNIGLYLLAFLITSNNSFYSVILTSNTMYGINKSSILKRRLKALILSFILIMLFLITLIILTFGNNLVNTIILFVGSYSIKKLLYFILVILKWLISFGVIFWTINFVYAVAPDKIISSKYTKKGTFFVTIVWLFSTFIYTYYVNNIANYDVFYGSLSSIMVLMIWIYFLSFVFVIGLAINANIYLEFEKKVKK